MSQRAHALDPEREGLRNTRGKEILCIERYYQTLRADVESLAVASALLRTNLRFVLCLPEFVGAVRTLILCPSFEPLKGLLTLLHP